MGIVIEGVVALAVLYALYFVAKEGFISTLVAIIGAVIFFVLLPVMIKALVMMIVWIYFVTNAIFFQPKEA